MGRDGDGAAGRPQCGQRMIFTGPNGVGDYRPRSGYFPLYIGVGDVSPEATGDLAYLWRAAPNAPPPKPKQGYVGEIGWGWKHSQLLNRGTLHSNVQIKKTEFRATLEDRVTQRFQDQE
ncbi:hypothetical protein JOB18_003422 [Solea senegalensis]|uniref:Uncharacterized protein n=1 Tax=Solea senegalensis TaxID=28829 RepID=A0AAV6SJL9_SOLSE|nr:uncharacterized protein C4orf45 homolog [Solea senegalensis]KAG7517279.1 hypothetical protein JOB18_003422 [Solea senegalensis]